MPLSLSLSLTLTGQRVVLFLTLIIGICFAAPTCTSYSPTQSLDLSVSGGTIGYSWPAVCSASIKSDFDKRDKLKEYNECEPNDTWGPRTQLYPKADIPAICSRKKWQQERVLAIIDKVVKLELNYCHHHTLSWVPPEDKPGKPRFRVSSKVCSKETLPPGLKVTCSGANNTNNNQWKGVDCSHFTSHVYNYAFGAHLNTGIHTQACGPSAPGRALPYGVNDQDKFEAGDLLFIAGDGTARPLFITHVVFWTGFLVTNDTGKFGLSTLLKNIRPCDQSLYEKYVQKLWKEGKKVYVIADSNFNGPRYRPFVGWWSFAFSHARRLIDPDTSLPRQHSTTQFNENKNCVNNIK